MRTGIQISSFKPLMTDEKGLESVLSFMRQIRCHVTQLQWIDKSIPAYTVADLLEHYEISAIGAQDKTFNVLSDLSYYIDLCQSCGGNELCLSGIPDGDAESFAGIWDALESYLVAKGITLSFHPIKNDLNGALDRLLEIKPEIMLTPDVCQLHDAGLDPAKFIISHAGHIKTVHFKDRNLSGELCAVGKGAIDFVSAYAACEKAGAELILAEQETWSDAFSELKAGFKYVNMLADVIII